MASRTVNVRVHDLHDLVASFDTFSFTYTPIINTSRYDKDVRGIAFDGQRLVFSTTANLLSTSQGCELVYVDLESRTIVDQFLLANTSLGYSIEDICHCPENDTFWGILKIAGSPSSWYLVQIDPAGKSMGNVLATLPDNSRAIMWDGYTLFISSWDGTPYTLNDINAWDAPTQAALPTNTWYHQSMQVTNWQACGLAHYGSLYVQKGITLAPPLVGGRIFYGVQSDPTFTWQWLLSAGTHVSGEDTPITIDSERLYDFDQG